MQAEKQKTNLEKQINNPEEIIEGKQNELASTKKKKNGQLLA